MSLRQLHIPETMRSFTCIKLIALFSWFVEKETMPNINRGIHFLLTKAVEETVSQNLLTEAVIVIPTASVNTSIFSDIFLI